MRRTIGILALALMALPAVAQTQWWAVIGSGVDVLLTVYRMCSADPPQFPAALCALLPGAGQSELAAQIRIVSAGKIPGRATSLSERFRVKQSGIITNINGDDFIVRFKNVGKHPAYNVYIRYGSESRAYPLVELNQEYLATFYYDPMIRFLKKDTLFHHFSDLEVMASFVRTDGGAISFTDSVTDKHYTDLWCFNETSDGLQPCK